MLIEKGQLSLEPLLKQIRPLRSKSPLFDKLYVFLSQFYSDSLYRNSIYLMLSTLSLAGFGFIFWAIVARLYEPQDVGLATTLISVAGLISNFSLFGLNNTLIRFLPKSENKNDLINTVFTTVILVTLVLSTGFLIGLHWFSPDLLFIRENGFLIAFFMVSMVLTTLNLISDNVFIANRSSHFILLYNVCQGLVKIALPFFFVSAGALGIYYAVNGALLTSFTLSILFMQLFFSFKPKPTLHRDTIKNTSKFSLAMYLATFAGIIPIQITPLLVTNALGPTSTAYYYMAMMIANLLYYVPIATSQSLFAESSQEESQLKQNIRKAALVVGALVTCGIVFAILLGNIVLSVFGTEYQASYPLLILLAVNGYFMGMNNILSTIFKVKHSVFDVVVANILSGTVSLLVISQTIQYGLGYLGWSFIAGSSVATIYYFIRLRFSSILQ